MTKKLDLFPYKPRPHQQAILDTVRSLLASEPDKKGPGAHLVMESPTGSGKTICTLVPCLEAALEKGKRIIYTTRTNSQQLQVLKELRQVVKASKRKILGIGIQGRSNMCPLVKDHPDWLEGTPEELSSLCGDLKKMTLSKTASGTGKELGCPYYRTLLATDMEQTIHWVSSELPTIEELVKHCSGMGICPYELVKRLMPGAQVVVAPYIFVFHPQIRGRLFEWTKMDPKETVLIVDEAHNLPEYLRELQSVELGQVSLRRATTEAHENGDPMLSGEVMASELMKVLEETILTIEKEYIIDEDGLVPEEELFIQLLTRLKMASPRLLGMIKELMVHGEIIKETKRKGARLPRSYLSRVALFLNAWSSLDGEAFIKLVRRERDQAFLQAYCMDPSLAGDALTSMAYTIHMSGTLALLEEYRDSIGLPRDGATMLKSFPSPFAKENLLTIYSDAVTTQYETMQKNPSIIPQMKDLIVDICKRVPCNTALFFPSFDLLRKMDTLGLSSDLRAFGRKVFIENQGEQSLLMDTIVAYKAATIAPESKGAILFAVAGGRVSEGMDFPERELDMAIIVGIPFPKPTARLKALTFFYDRRFRKGWEYIVKGPTERKVLQTLGRLVRSETDIGVAVILDSRSLGFSERLPGLTLEKDPAKAALAFFEKKAPWWDQQHS
jgi:DNA excision repair protein ERCC-2